MEIDNNNNIHETNNINHFINKIIYPSQTLTVTTDQSRDILPQQLQHNAIHTYRLYSTKSQYGTIQHKFDDNDNNKLINKHYGILQHNTALNIYNIRHISNIYIPHINDLVIGTIYSKTAEYYRINLGKHCNIVALLPLYAFQGASKRNHPNLKPGTTVYCRIQSVVTYSNDSIELSCISPYIKQKDWVTGENIFGELSNGYTFTVSLHYGYKLLQPDCIILSLIESKLKIVYEIAVGMNGIVWCNSNSVANTIVIVNLILKTEHMTKQQIVQEINQFAKRSAAE